MWILAVGSGAYKCTHVHSYINTSASRTYSEVLIRIVLLFRIKLADLTNTCLTPLQSVVVQVLTTCFLPVSRRVWFLKIARIECDTSGISAALPPYATSLLMNQNMFCASESSIRARISAPCCE